MKKLIRTGIVAAIVTAVCLSLERLNVYMMIKTGREIPVISDIMHDDALRVTAIVIIICCFGFSIVKNVKKA